MCTSQKCLFCWTDTIFLNDLSVFYSPSDPQDENKIGIDGIQQFCDDLNLDPASISVLVVAWKFRAATQCEFSKKEFIDGMTELGWAMKSLLYLVIILTISGGCDGWDYHSVIMIIFGMSYIKCPTTWQNQLFQVSLTVLGSNNYRQMDQTEMLDVSQSQIIILHVQIC